MAHFGYLVPGTGLDPAEERRRLSILQKLAPKLQLDILTVTEGPQTIESEEDEQKAIGPTVALARQHQQEFDGFIIGCFADIAIDELREALSIPVIGPARSVYTTAAMMYPKFSVITIQDALVEHEWQMAERLDCKDRVDAVLSLNIAVKTIIERPDEAIERVKQTVHSLHTSAFFVGCMSYAFLLAEQTIKEVQGLKLFNPLETALGMAYALSL
jgi:allantoin racemase